jgi:hypothetical protein
MPQTVAEPPVMPQATPEPVQPGPEPKSLETIPMETPEEPRPEYRTQTPLVREQVEGIPRCSKCGVAISSFDDFCSECGAKLK